MGHDPGLSLTFTNGTELNDAGPWGEPSIDGCCLKAYGNEFAHYDPSDGLWHVTDGAAIGAPGLTGGSWPTIILGQAKLG